MHTYMWCIGPKSPSSFYIVDKHHVAYAMFEATLQFNVPIAHRALYYIYICICTFTYMHM